MNEATDGVIDTANKHSINLRDVAYILVLERIMEAMKVRGGGAEKSWKLKDKIWGKRKLIIGNWKFNKENHGYYKRDYSLFPSLKSVIPLSKFSRVLISNNKLLTLPLLFSRMQELVWNS